MRLLLSLVLALLMAACSALAPDKPVRATTYDLGPEPMEPAPTQMQTPIVLEDIEAAPALETSALLYRLAYADAHQLQPYAHARWSAQPARLVRQRLRERLGRDRAVLDPTESASLARVAGTMPRVLHVELEEFSQTFDSPTQSWGVLRLRATLLSNTPGGERLIAQHVIAKREPAPSADAAGGVRALSAAADAAAQEVAEWLAQQR
ncbi:MAG TPA: ABC-type transport auxiliary lipoprotein family protein [Ramlibacter sp.]|nr:ABC-type transport auxiliary lipoprotein family protein [Ramlibacter sp.]